MIRVGTIVHAQLGEYADPTKRVDNACRPAIVVRTWGQQVADSVRPMVQLQVFLDGSNDGYANDRAALWQTSIPHRDNPSPGYAGTTYHTMEECSDGR